MTELTRAGARRLRKNRKGSMPQNDGFYGDLNDGWRSVRCRDWRKRDERLRRNNQAHPGNGVSCEKSPGRNRIVNPRRRDFGEKCFRGEVFTGLTVNRSVPSGSGRGRGVGSALNAAIAGRVVLEVGVVSRLGTPDKGVPQRSTKDQVETDEQQGQTFFESCGSLQLTTSAVNYS